MKTPRITRKLSHGRPQAIVTLADAVTKKRRAFHLGPFGSDEAAAAYDRTIAAWLAAGRRHPDADTKQAEGGPAVSALLEAFWLAEAGRYSDGEAANYKGVVRLARRLHGLDTIASYGPNKARQLRQAMIAAGWSRGYINKQINRLRSIWKWGVSHELVDAGQWHALKALEPLRAGQSAARETEAVQPVDVAIVEAALLHLSDEFAAVARLQLATGARPGEVLALTTGMIDTTGQIWTAEIVEHKTAHHGKKRTLYFGPAAQAIVAPFLSTDLARPLFYDREKNGGKSPAAMRRDSYSKAVERACRIAFPPPPHLARQRVAGNGRKIKSTRLETTREWRERLGVDGWAALKQHERDTHWHPHQLRHTAATEIRKSHGLEAAALILGHSSAAITDAVYAERDTAKIAKVIREIG